ncbi:uncharacterized protein LOC141558978 isoform X3 [Sminthopsis crassicaudata]|uniref:uncharacterized protein LOC141558978 isoform X3 n=1 Tax=Sminthopsis crassicaudata TaxID=9301 RepID=UPI003D699543
MDVSGQNTGHLLKLSSGTCLERRGWNPGLVIVAVCSLWVSASLALAGTSLEQQGLFPDPSTRTLDELPLGDFSTSPPMQNDMDQSQEPWGLAKEVVPLPPEVLTGPVGKTLAPGKPFLSRVVPEGSKDKGASRQTQNRQSQNPFSLFSQHSSLGLKSRLLPKIRTLQANETLKSQGPPKGHTKESLAQVNLIDADDSGAAGLPQTPSIDSLGTMRPTERGDPMGDCKICLGHHGLSTESAMPAAASKAQLTVKSSSRALSHPQYKVGFAPSPSKEGLVSISTHPNPGPPETPRSPSLPRGAFSAVPFPSFGVSRGTETESHVPKLLRASLLSPSSENPRGHSTSTSAIPAASSWPIESELHSREPKKVAPASKDLSPISPLDHIWISAFPTPTRFEERSPRVTGSDQELLATIKEHEGHSPVGGFCSDPILQHDLPTQRSELLSAGSGGVLEEASEPVEAADSDSGFLLSPPPRVFAGVTPKRGQSPVATSEALSPSAPGSETPAWLKTRAWKASLVPKPSASFQPVIPESSGMPEEQLEDVSEVGAGSASLDQVVPTGLAAFLPESQAKGSTLAPPNTWANTFPSELEKAQTPLVGRQERGRWPPGMMSHPVLGTPAHVARWLGSNHSPSKLVIEPLKRSTSPMAVPSRPQSGRGIWRSRGVLPHYPQSTSEREGLIDSPTSETGSAGGELTETTTVLKEELPWDEEDPHWNPKFEDHKIPLNFRLNLISYDPALADSSSVSFRRLKWEVTFMFRQMLSHMNGFYEFYVLQFLNGSVLVQSEVEVTGDPYPTSSDVIRCIATLVHEEMKMHFSWMIDIPSLSSRDYWIGNLDPEKLHIVFTMPKFGLLSTGKALDHLLENLTEQVIQNLEELYPVTNLYFFEIRENQGNLYLKAELSVHSEIWADISSILEALIHLANQSVDLSSLNVEGYYLDLQRLPITFQIVNRKFETFLLEPRHPEHLAFFKDLANAVCELTWVGPHLQPPPRNDSFICVGELLFQIPSPEVQDILHTLHKAVTSDGHLADSQFQVNSSSFLIAEEHLDFSEPKNMSSIILAAIALCILIVFVTSFLIIQCMRNRRCSYCCEGVFSNYQMQREMIELENQQAENLVSGGESLDSQVPLEEESGSSC